MDDSSRIGKPSGLRRKASLNVTFCVKKEKSINYKKVYAILQKSESDRTEEENETLENSATIVKEVNTRLEKRRRLKSRSEEIEDQPSILAEKCRLLAGALLNAQHLVVYSGAGVSTAARIPDYRGTNGIWTRLQQGKDIGCHDLTQAEPTITHMALFALYRCGKLKHIVSQNCDGLHLRSGVPRSALSEVHGNMYLEVCTPCKLEYWRLFDVTEHTGRYSHETARLCFCCRKPLRDTIVHFGERGALRWPLNWKGACDNADKADIILCIGSSLKVLKRYPWLWCMDKPVKKRPLLFIVNLQWTPKDDQATLKINGKCDEVMSLVMSHLGMNIPKYIRHLDPIFAHATVLHEVELHTTSQPILKLDVKQKENEKRQEELSCGIKCENVSIDDDFSGNIIISDIGGIEEVKFDLVQEEVVITTSEEDVIIESNIVKMETDEFIDDNESFLIRDCDQNNTLNCNKHEFHSNNTDNIDSSDDKLCKNDNDNPNIKLKNDLWRPFNDVSSGNGGCSSGDNKNIQNDIDDKKDTNSITGTNNSIKSTSDFLIDNVETTGFTVPLDEFDKLYCKIGKELAKKNSGEFFQEFCFNNDDKKSNICKSVDPVIKTEFYTDDNGVKGEFSSDVDLLTQSTKISQGDLINSNSSNDYIKNNKLSNNFGIKNNINCDNKFDLIQTVPLDLSLVKSSKTTVIIGNKNEDGGDKNCIDDTLSCRFCSENYANVTCQFYKRLIPVIPENGPFCYCCDDEDDNSDNDNPMDGNINQSDNKSTATTSNNSNATNNKVPIVNPGWFGKGYRKRAKKKR